MRYGIVLLSLALAACASAPAPQRDARFFHDSLFRAPSEQISAGDVFALSADMNRYINDEIERPARKKGRQLALVDALYNRGALKLEYDTEMTRTAAILRRGAKETAIISDSLSHRTMPASYRACEALRGN